MAMAANDSSPAAPCCTISSDKQAPLTESKVTTDTTVTAAPLAVAARLDWSFLHPAANERRDSTVPQAPEQSSLCTFLI